MNVGGRFLRSLAIAAFCIDLIPLFYHYHLKDHSLYSPLTPYHPYLKTALLPLIGLMSYLSTPAVPPRAVAAVILAALGDFVLCSHQFIMVLVGGLIFAASHIVLIRHFNVSLIGLPGAAYALMLALVVLISAALFPSFTAFSEQTVSFTVYAIILLSAACTAIARVSRYGWSSLTFLLCAGGYTLVVVSDAILLRDEIARGAGRRSFAVAVMVTYIAGQLCIHLGVAAAIGFPLPRAHAD
jgi:hypothetical protein